MKKPILLSAVLLFFWGGIFSQKPGHVPGEILVQFGAEIDVGQAVAQMPAAGLPLTVGHEVSPPLHVWLLTFDFSQNKEEEMLEKLRRWPGVTHAQFNHFVEMRSTVPNDPLFDQQWYWQNTGQTGGTPNADVDADLAWDITTGGATLMGQEIVVCVMEGTNRSHPDLAGNLWQNLGEIPDDNIDNDGNGYTDDFEGWNVSTLTDFINPEQHGTAVSGAIGAKGNNGQLLTGLNWDVKLMHVDFTNAVESDIVAGYTYPLVQRRRFNASDGTEGALVVATNASWGIDGGDPADFPLWCAVYDSLGAAGILSCVATTNDNVNVDVVGDMPGNCPSEFVICATATDADDERTFSGYGPLNVDVAAPGEDLTLLNLNGGPLNDSGTSYASPLVAGLVALLYSAPCSSIGQRAVADPVGMAELVREAIFDGVDVRPNLIGEVKTAGRVNAFSSLEILLENCNRCEQPFGLGATNLTDVQGSLVWTSTDSTLTTDLRWRMLGQPAWTEVSNVTSPHLLTGLMGCTEYEFQLQDHCADTMSGFTPSFVFETDGCCEAPDNVVVTNISTSGGTVSWSSVLAALSYTLVVDGPGGPLLIENLATTSYDLTGLAACTGYDIFVEVVCAGGADALSDPVELFTLGCGTCLDAAYCPSESENSVDEWIANVTLNTLENNSGADSGYGDYTAMSTDLVAWEGYEISLTPGFTGFEYDEWWAVWIDLDHDGTFDGTDEQVFNSNGTANTTVVGNILIPGDAVPGPTRMRVVMRFNSEPTACDATFNFGEVEDYCVNIVPGTEPDCHPPTGLNVPVIGSTFAEMSWEESPEALNYEIRVRPLSLPFWTVISTGANHVTALNLEFCDMHQFQVRSVCVDTKSIWSPSANFMTGCTSATGEAAAGLQEATVFPNPFSGDFSVRFFNDNPAELEFSLCSPAGREVARHSAWFGAGGQQYLFAAGGKGLAAGIYFLKIKTERGTVVRKVVAAP